MWLTKFLRFKSNLVNDLQHPLAGVMVKLVDTSLLVTALAKNEKYLKFLNLTQSSKSQLSTSIIVQELKKF